MKIDIRAVSRDTGALMDVDIYLEPSQIGLESEGFMFRHPVRFAGIVKNISKGVLQLTGNVQTVVNANCDRCLSETEFEVSDMVDVIFKSVNGNDRSTEFESNDSIEYDDEDEYYYSGFDLSPDKAIRDGVLLALPNKVLCREECKGFCTICKTNLNENNCICDENDKIRRNQFDELRKLL